MAVARRTEPWWTRPRRQLVALGGLVLVIVGLVVTLVALGSPARGSLEHEARTRTKAHV